MEQAIFGKQSHLEVLISLHQKLMLLLVSTPYQETLRIIFSSEKGKTSDGILRLNTTVY